MTSASSNNTAGLESELRSELVRGCKVLHRSGMDTMAGHLSVRLDADHIIIKPRAVSWDRLGPDELVIMDMDGRRVGGDGTRERGAVLEWPLHTEVYRLRPDVNSVLHAHARDSTLFGALGLDMEPLTRETSLFCGRLPVHDTPECLFCHGNMVTTREMGQEIAELLGDNDAALLRYHGTIVATGSIGETAGMAYELELAARSMLQAASIRSQPIMDPYKREAMMSTFDRRRAAILKMMKNERWQKLQDYYLEPDEIGVRTSGPDAAVQAETMKVLGIA